MSTSGSTVSDDEDAAAGMIHAVGLSCFFCPFSQAAEMNTTICVQRRLPIEISGSIFKYSNDTVTNFLVLTKNS